MSNVTLQDLQKTSLFREAEKKPSKTSESHSRRISHKQLKQQG